MSPSPQHHPSADYVAEARRWLAFARGDLDSAQALIQTTTPNRNVGYLAQQAAEKALKAVILLGNASFQMTHNLTALGAQLPSDFPSPVATEALAWLADLETMARYPDEGDTITMDDAKKAVELANTILAAVASHFSSHGVNEAEIVPE